MRPPPRDVVVIAPNWLGDAVMSLPLLGFLAAAGVRVSVIAPGATARVYWGLEEVRDLFIVRRSGKRRGVLSKTQILQRRRPCGAIVLPPSFSSALAPFLSGTPLRVGYRTDGRGALLTHALPARGLREEHLSQNFLRLGRALTGALRIDVPVRCGTPLMSVCAAERVSVGEKLKEAGAPTADYAVAVPGATYGETKAWPAAKYRKLVRELSAKLPVVLAGAAAERGLCRTVGSGLPGVYDLSGRTSVGELFALIESARVVVANDSGAAHVAASLRVPLVVIFGSTLPRWTAPTGDTVRVVRHPVSCSPCFLERCPTELECYDGVRPEHVLNSMVDAMGAAAERYSGGASQG